MDYHLTWYKCCPHWDNVQWHWLGSIPQRSRSHKTSKGQSTHACVCTITYICIDGLPSNLVQMLPTLIRCAYIQEYLGYRSNNLYFLFSHSWPVVVYNFCSVLTYQSGWEKNKMLFKKNSCQISKNRSWSAI